MRRAVDVGVIYGPRSTLADIVFDRIAKSGLKVERNVPYQIDFAGDKTLPGHGENRRLDYVEIEICQDLIGAAAGLVGGLLIERNQTSPCHDCIRVDGLPVYTTLIGGILGGLSGLMVHAIRTISD